MTVITKDERPEKDLAQEVKRQSAGLGTPGIYYGDPFQSCYAYPLKAHKDQAPLVQLAYRRFGAKPDWTTLTITEDAAVHLTRTLIRHVPFPADLRPLDDEDGRPTREELLGAVKAAARKWYQDHQFLVGDDMLSDDLPLELRDLFDLLVREGAFKDVTAETDAEEK